MKALFSICAIMVLLSACDKNDDETMMENQTTAVSDYVKLEVGNYWIYDKYSVLGDGTENSLGQDSVVIASDTLIGGQTYFVRELHPHAGGFGGVSRVFLRDSLDYIVQSDGTIIFSSSDFSTVLNFFESEPPGPHYTISSSMTDGEVTYTVPAGSFDCLENVSEINSTDPSLSDIMFPKHNARAYSPGIGLVYDKWHWLNTDAFIDYRLAYYNIQ